MKKLILILLTLSISLTHAQKPGEANVSEKIPIEGVKKGLSDEQLLEIVQKQTFRYFWHYGHPKSGLARERSNTVRCNFYWDYINEADDEPNLSKDTFGPEAGAIGGTGFGILATIIATERKWISKDAALDRLIQIADFLNKADSYHGIYPHFMNAETGKTIPFDRIDNGSDIVEHSYLMFGFICAKEYFKGNSIKEKYLQKRIDQMWYASNWNWHAQQDNKYLFWHWSEKQGFDMNFPIWGYSEALITYMVSAASPNHSISREVYDINWVRSNGWKNGNSYYGYKLPLGNYEGGGPLFFEHYTFMVVDPNGLKDDHGTDYKEQVVNHTLINRAYCIENPKKFKGYGENFWGLTAGDSYKGYVAHCPQDDRGVIQPTAAISSIPFTPKESIKVLRHLYEDMGDKIWGEYGFHDGVSKHYNWSSNTYLAIDQGPIIVMIENYRTGLIWKLFMNNPDIQKGLKKLGFSSPYFK